MGHIEFAFDHEISEFSMTARIAVMYMEIHILGPL